MENLRKVFGYVVGIGLLITGICFVIPRVYGIIVIASVTIGCLIWLLNRKDQMYKYDVISLSGVASGISSLQIIAVAESNAGLVGSVVGISVLASNMYVTYAGKLLKSRISDDITDESLDRDSVTVFIAGVLLVTVSNFTRISGTYIISHLIALVGLIMILRAGFMMKRIVIKIFAETKARVCAEQKAMLSKLDNF
jgi:hypothetical protein